MNDLVIKQTREYVSRILFMLSLDLEQLLSEQILSRTKPVFAVVDGAAEWFFDRHFGAWANVKKMVVQNTGEEIKIRATRDQIVDFLLESRAERSTTLLAVGGGLILDTAGLAASECKRGIPWVAIPTTLLAHVDASIGGKTAVNHPLAKNAIGQFYPPTNVVITPEVSETWSLTHRLEGRAEQYKIFSLFDFGAIERILANPDDSSLVQRSIELKAQVVRVDPWERGLRGSLNYGHTFGHAFEHITHMPHGLAVALGVRNENRVAEQIDIMSPHTRAKIDRDLDDLGFTIPKTLPPFDQLLPYILQDKKVADGKVRLAMIDGVNELSMSEFDPTRAVAIEIMETAYKQFCDDTRIVTESKSSQT